ncbi:MAG TPA: response regulator transcription factor [Hyphomicrobiaceae bacterium]|nr:response regulator transcription factor [Hyphomicrobiaceae bacterium]
MKFLVVDDHALIREAMRGVLKELQGDALILDAASSRQAMDIMQQHPDLALVLLDLKLPDRDGIEVLGELRERFPATSIVMLSAFNDRENVVRALDNGALGFIPKTDSREVLLGALRLILAGGTYSPPEALTREPAGTATASTPSPEKRPSPAELGLTERQVDVLALMMQGKSNKLICRALDLAEPTVKNHVSAILKALDVTNRTEAVLAVAALGWELQPPAR